MINGEKAACCTPTFAEKRERTLGLLLKGVEQKCSTEVRTSFVTWSMDCAKSLQYMYLIQIVLIKYRKSGNFYVVCKNIFVVDGSYENEYYCTLLTLMW